MQHLSDAERNGLRAGLVITVMAAFLAGLQAESFVTGFLTTAVVCGLAIVAATALLHLVNSRKGR